ncbi:hypothetical protein DFAR_3610011 [Desulfarculales bacterium]
MFCTRRRAPACSVQGRPLHLRCHLIGTTNLLVAAKDVGVKRFVSASSFSVYGDREDAAAPKRK